VRGPRVGQRSHYSNSEALKSKAGLKQKPCHDVSTVAAAKITFAKAIFDFSVKMLEGVSFQDYAGGSFEGSLLPDIIPTTDSAGSKQ
jgi:hypothetical protein